MGLEMVDIVLRVEKTFGLRLPKARVSEVRTVGDFYTIILDLLDRDIDGQSVSHEVLGRLATALSAAGVPSSEQISELTPLAGLFPWRGRRRQWRRFGSSANLTLPPLEYGQVLCAIGLLISVVFGIVSICLMVGDVGSGPSVARDWLVIVSLPLVLMTSIFWLLLLRWLARPLAVCWPSGMNTLGDLARWVAREHYGELIACEKRFNSEEVWCILQKIVADVVGIDPNKVTKQSRFVEDLGAS